MREKRHLSQLSDDEVLALYTRHGNNAAKAAREVGCGPSTFRTRIGLIKDEGYQKDKERIAAATFIMEELEARGIDPREVRVGAATVKTEKKRYSGFHKDEKTGQAVVTPLKSDTRLVTIKFSPKFEDGPAWPLIAPAIPSKLVHSKRPDVLQNANPSAARRVFIWPDTQIGYYRSVLTGELTPFHDVKAIDVALQMLERYLPDEVVILGDFLDLPSMSRWLQLPEFQHTLQPSLQYAYNLLACIRLIVGQDAKVSYLAGNHERRLAEYVAKNAIAAYGVRPAETDPNEVDPVTLVPKRWSWPQLSIPKLLHLEDLGITYSAEYPGGQIWLTPHLVATHQPPDRVTDLRATVLHGHVMQVSTTTRTVHYHHGREEYGVYAIPGLMRMDDVSDQTMLSRTSVPSNRARCNGQQAVASVLIVDDETFDIQVHRIKDGRGVMHGQVFEAR